MISLNLLPAPFHQLIGHRGASIDAPENTLASFKRASTLGLNWIEFDVRLTKDEELIIFHDDKLERTTNGSGLVIDHTLAQIKQLEAGSWFSAEFKDEKIPTLIETIPWLKAWNLTPVIELKCEPNQPLAAVQKLAYTLADCLKKHWTHSVLPMVSSFEHQALLYYLHRLNKPALVGFLVDDLKPQHIDLAHQIPHSTLHCSAEYLSPQRVQTLQKEGLPLLIFTVNDKALSEAYLKAGAYAIFTDCASKLI